MYKILLPDETLCCGCLNCSYVCSRNAIYYETKNGFKKAHIDDAKCIRCGKCMSVCPIIDTENSYNNANNIKKAYAAKSTQEEIVLRSSSGGISRAIIETVVKKDPNAVIYGCGIINNKVHHYRATCSSDFDLFYGSKYVASTFDDVQKSILNDLSNDKMVLFFGTPCQNAAIKIYTPKKMQNKLVLVDVICHGPGSPIVFEEYVSFLENIYHRHVEVTNFRDKKGGWKNYSIRISIDGKENRDTNAIRTWNYLFFKGLIQNESCFQCRFACKRRYSDLTIADFWGIEKLNIEFDIDKGVSLLLVNSTKGESLVKEDNICKVPVDIKTATSMQQNLNGGHEMPQEYNAFWKEFNSFGYKYIAKKYAYYSLTGKVRNAVILIKRKIIR